MSFNTRLASLLLLMPLCAGAETPRIPLGPGLVVTQAKQGDTYNGRPVDTEIITAITGETADAYHLTARFVYRNADGKSLSERMFKRSVLKSDVAGSHRYGTLYSVDVPEQSPGMTYAMMTSTDVIERLRKRGKVSFMHLNRVNELRAPLNIITDRMLTRVGEGSEPFSVLLNGERVQLPALHTKGELPYRDELVSAESVDYDYWWLDDPASPLFLAANWNSPDGKANGSNRTVRIDFPQAQVAELQQALGGAACRAELHGIYFNTASATLLPESDPVLSQIAELLKANPAWKITVEGHTDNTGTPDYNRSLSQRRADAVSTALTARYGVPAAQLAVAGYGETKPVEPNTTLEGRARNRRVELARQCQ